ncbi:MAG: hypothetical protein L6Q66_14055, partial [Bacteroidia bacterium]|nr:hypothetical protein [Bacteroidia bacterium]
MKLKMGIRPILFSTPMVQGILDDRKTQTRRELKDQINGIAKPGTHICPYGKVGDVLWVRETHYAYGHWTKITTTETGKVEWKFADLTIDHGKEYYYETNPPEQVLKRKTGGLGYYRRPSIFMPKEAARIFLEINNERMERLKDISRGDCMSEGCPFPNIAKETDPVSWFS